MNEPLPVATLVAMLKAGTLPRAEWTHLAHLRAGAWFVHTRGLAPACAELPEVIRRYNEASGVANSATSGYHETLTLAYLQAIDRQRRALAEDVKLDDLIAGVMDSFLADSHWPERYWSRAVLWSAEARRHWVEPDLQPLPA